jgi:hypothetical protein
MHELTTAGSRHLSHQPLHLRPLQVWLNSSKLCCSMGLVQATTSWPDIEHLSLHAQHTHLQGVHWSCCAQQLVMGLLAAGLTGVPGSVEGRVAVSSPARGAASCASISSAGAAAAPLLPFKSASRQAASFRRSFSSWSHTLGASPEGACRRCKGVCDSRQALDWVARARVHAATQQHTCLPCCHDVQSCNSRHVKAAEVTDGILLPDAERAPTELLPRCMHCCSLVTHMAVKAQQPQF